MKRWSYLIVAAAFLAGGVLSIALAGPEMVKIENKYARDLKKPVTLSHKKHAETYKIACTECHHTWKKAERKTPQKCAACHKEKAEGKKLSTKRAYHKQCQGCHKALKAQGKKTGPTTKCTGCHPSKRKK
ncbi:MAG: cytochrome c3 family protein [Deltaproteobacteria bacterium]|nr:cytochrome c3 family protein [Deltaproteobacteria bacterium]